MRRPRLDQTLGLQGLEVLPESGVAASFDLVFLADEQVELLCIPARDFLGFLQATADAEQNQLLMFRQIVNRTRLQRCLAQSAGPDVLGEDFAASGFLGASDGRVEQFDGHSSVAGIGREAADLGEGFSGDAPHSASYFGALRRDAGEGVGIVGSHLDEVGLSEARNYGGFEEFEQGRILANENHRDRALGFLPFVDSKQFVDDVRRVAIDQHIDLVEDEQKMALVGVEVAANRLDDFSRAEASFWVSGVEAQRDLLQDLRAGRVVAAIDVGDDDSAPTVEVALDVIRESLGEDGLARADRTDDHGLCARIVILDLREDSCHVTEFLVATDEGRRNPVVRQGALVEQDLACSDAVEVSCHSTESCSHRS